MRFVYWWWWGPVVSAIGFFMGYICWNANAPLILRGFMTFGGLIFVVVGALMTRKRDELQINLDLRTYARRRGNWPALTEEDGSLDEITRVGIVREMQSGGGGRSTPAWVIRIEFKDTAKNISVAQFVGEQPAYRRLAELAAKLRVPSADENENVSIHPNATAHAAVAPTVSSTSLPPRDSRIMVHGEAPRREIILPALGFNIATPLLLAFPIGLVVMAVAGINHDLERSHQILQSTYVLASICGLLALGGFLLITAGVFAQTVILEDPDSILVANRLFGRDYGFVTLPKASIDEVAIRETAHAGAASNLARQGTPVNQQQVQGMEVFLRSGSTIKRVGSNLNVFELEWLRDTIKSMSASD